jgi:hypothetical protein
MQPLLTRDQAGPLWVYREAVLLLRLGSAVHVHTLVYARLETFNKMNLRYSVPCCLFQLHAPFGMALHEF